MTVALHHVDEGPRDAPVLLFSGSLGSTLDMWRPQVAPLTERFRVIRVDHRGHGGSPVPPGPYRIADLAGDVLALLDALGLDRVAYCGLSMGGCVGLHLASEAPERISALTLCCTSSHWPDPTVWTDRIAAVESGGTAPIAETVVSRWFTPSFAAAHPDVVADAVGQVAGTPTTGTQPAARPCATSTTATGSARSPPPRWSSPGPPTRPRRSSRTPARSSTASRAPAWRCSTPPTWPRSSVRSKPLS